MLQPKYIDPKNKYRYYDSQSFVVAKILSYLRMFNFSIQEMLAAVKEESLENLETILQNKKNCLEEEIQQINAVIEEIDELLEYAKGEKEHDEVE